MSVATAPRIGDPAPDFTLRDQHGQEISLHEQLRQAPVLLVFYPFAWSGICTGEFGAILDDLSGFSADGAVQLYGVSCDPMFTLRAWAQDQGFGIDLLSDFWPHGEVARSYGVFEETVGAAVRGTFLIDRSGTVRWVQVNGIGQARDFDGYRAAVDAL